MPTFKLTDNKITFLKSGAVGLVSQNQHGYIVQLDASTHHLDEKKAKGLEKRMTDWYFFTQIRKINQ